MEQDANRPVTMGDFRQLMDRIDERFGKLDAKFDRIAIDFARLRGEFHDTKQSIFEFITKKSDWIVGTVTRFHEDVQETNRRGIMNKHRLDLLEPRVDALERREKSV